MNKHRNTQSRQRRGSKTADFRCQPPPEPGQQGAFTSEDGNDTPPNEPSIVPDSGIHDIRDNHLGGAPTVVGCTPYDFIVENLGGLSSALAAFVRRVRPIVFLIVVAYVLLCIFARPSGPPMPFKTLCVLLVGYDLLGKPLRKFFRRLITRS